MFYLVIVCAAISCAIIAELVSEKILSNQKEAEFRNKAIREAGLAAREIEMVLCSDGYYRMK